MINAQTIQSFIPNHSILIVGFSGGPDSVYLLTLLKQLEKKLNLTIIAAHLNHQWRDTSNIDAQWCQTFCHNLQIKCVVKTPAELDIAIKFNGSKEEVGRKLRRKFFEQLAMQYQANYIVLAHHQDDQIENFFIRLIRGSSVTGLSSMKQLDQLYLRPLLNINKQTILDFLHHYNISYLIDETNNSSQFLRNRIRHQLIPELSNIDQRSLKKISSSITHLQKTNDFLEQITQETMKNICDQQNSDMINIASFLQLHEILQHRILLNLFIKFATTFTASTALFEEIIRFLKSNKHQEHQIHTNYSLIKKSGYFYFKSL